MQAVFNRNIIANYSLLVRRNTLEHLL